MISFIIIGKNEGFKLYKCFNSIFKTIKINNLKNFEIIYVDSNSTDNSIEIAMKFNNLKVFLITGACNAAIARNIGAIESTGDVLFFIDGDMEIQHNFLPLVYDENSGLKYNFVSGQWINYYYDFKGLLVNKEVFKETNFEDKNLPITGGIFFIKRHLWFQLKGMKTKLKVHEDYDLGLRLAKQKVFLLRKKDLLAIHHTIPYNDRIRIWKLLLSGSTFYRIVLFRENIFNQYAWKVFIRNNYTFFILLISIFLSFYFYNIFLLTFYFLSVVLRTYFRRERKIRIILTNLIYFPIYEISLLFCFFLFWPKEKKLKYIRIFN